MPIKVRPLKREVKTKIAEVYERDPQSSNGEKIYIRIHGKLYDVTDGNDMISADPDLNKIKEIMRKERVNSYTEIHQHPYDKDSPIQIYGSIPSPKDFFGFLCTHLL